MTQEVRLPPRKMGRVRSPDPNVVEPKVMVSNVANGFVVKARGRVSKIASC